MRKYFYYVLFLTISSCALYAQPYGLEQRQSNTSLLITSNGSDVTDVEIKRVFANLDLGATVYLTHAGDGSDRLFVVEKTGRVLVFENNDNVADYKVFLDIRSRVSSGQSETGLLGLAFHPDYAQNGKFYLDYTPTAFKSRISEFQVSSDPDAADDTSERVLLEVPQPKTNHNGGMITFGPDGYLYIAFGDGGGAGDEFGNGQNLHSLLAAILRIDVDHQDPGMEYAIPTDNPFYNSPQNYKAEIWAYGLRNPWRFSFDRSLGTLWCADVGQNDWEEVDIIEKGGNYGWNIAEGKHCYASANCNPYDFETPIFEYSHEQGESITGGYVYRGPSLPQLNGFYLCGDFSYRRIWALKYDTETRHLVSSRAILSCPSPISSFGEDEAGEVYAVGYDGKIYRFSARDDAPPPGNVPETISASGLYSEINAQPVVAPGIIPYSVISRLWSDGAYKERYIALPGTEQIGFSRDGAYDFPAQTVLVKNFFLELEKGNPESRKLIETRFLVKRPEGELWDGFSYEWNEAGSDANLLADGKDVTFTITDPGTPGGQFDQVYHYPSRGECQTCHVPATGYVLGFKTSQLNSDHDYDGITDNQLRTLNHIALFTEDIGEDYHNFPQLTDPTDPDKDLTERARSYLDANCAFCHQPYSSGRSNMDLRISSSLADMNLVDIAPNYGDLGAAAPARISPGEPENSVLYLRMTSLDENRMPPIATNLVDETAAKVIHDWITELDSTPVPVELSSFNAKALDAGIILNWTVQSIYDSYGFDVQRRTHDDFVTIGFVKSYNTDTKSDYTFTDYNPPPGENSYRLKMIDMDGTFTYSAELSATTDVPSQHRLLPNHPNPFNSSTMVRFDLAKQSRTSINIYNILGKHITTLVDDDLPPGYHKVLWDGTDTNHQPVASGLYIIEFRAGQVVQRIKTTLLK